MLLLISLPLLAYDREDNLQKKDKPLFEQLSKELRCPTCQGLSVWESEANFSNQIKDMVKIKINEGLTRDEILVFFTERYGKWILRSPPKTGYVALAWWIPLAVLCISPLGLWYFFWRRKRVIASGGVRSVKEILQQMQQELQNMSKG